MNRAQRRKTARMKTGAAEHHSAAGKPDEEKIIRIIREQALTGHGLAGIRADHDAAFHRNMQANEIMKSMIGKSGFLEEELQKAREQGFKEGFNRAGMDIIRCCYAGICIALHDEFGFGAERCYRAVKACDEKIKWALHHSELTEELIRKSGLKIDWNEPFERVQRVDDEQKRGK